MQLPVSHIIQRIVISYSRWHLSRMFSRSDALKAFLAQNIFKLFEISLTCVCVCVCVCQGQGIVTRGVCVYVCVCICTCVSVCVYVPNGKPRGRFLVSYSITFCTCLPLRKGLSLTLDSSTVISLTDQQARVTLFSLPSTAMGLQASMGILNFMWLLENQT